MKVIEYNNFLGYITEVFALVILLLKSKYYDTNTNQPKLLSILFLLLLLPLYFVEYDKKNFYFFIVIAYRFAMYFFHAEINKDKPLTSLYFASLALMCYLIYSIIIQFTSLLYTQEYIIVANDYFSFLDYEIHQLLAPLIMLSIVEAVIHGIRTYRISDVDSNQLLSVFTSLFVNAFICFCFINSIISFTDIESVYLLTIIFLELFMFFFVIYSNRNIMSTNKAKKYYLQNVANEYRLSTVKANIEHTNNIRKLNHDIRNHMLSIKNLLINDRKEDAVDYVNDILQIQEKHNYKIHSGNIILDGILEEKEKDAEKHGIQFISDIDFRDCEFIDDIDVCIIFGNALDNAVEAASKICDGEKMIRIKGKKEIGHLFILIENSFAEVPVFSGSLLQTTKSDKNLHGYGLSNIKEAIEKYNSKMQYSISKDLFRLEIILPIPEPDRSVRHA